MIEIQCKQCKFKGDHKDFTFDHEYVDKGPLRYVRTYIECIECEAPRILLTTLRI
jgi:hypothetical protein